jgi:hypothetical protein
MLRYGGGDGTPEEQATKEDNTECKLMDFDLFYLLSQKFKVRAIETSL